MGFEPGDKVKSRNHQGVGRVEALGPFDTGLRLQYYDVFWGGSEGTKTVPEVDLEPADRRENRVIILLKADWVDIVTFKD